MKTAPFAFLFISLLFLLTNCSAESDSSGCSFEVEGVDGVCGVFAENASFGGQRVFIESLVRETVLAINNKMPISGIRIRLVNDPGMIIPEIGLGGFNPSATEVFISVDPKRTNLADILEKELAPLLAHEIHHAKRRRSVGYGNTLLEAMISEGLADHFSKELTGIAPPPWSIALNENELTIWEQEARTHWNDSGYNHDAWFFGAAANIPRWAGYSIGYELVKKYLEAESGRLSSNLHDEAAASFVSD